MQDKIDKISRSTQVSSEDIREIFDGLLSDSINNYHFLSQVKVLVNSLISCIELTNTGSLTVAAANSVGDSNTTIINAFTKPIFPTSIGEESYAERSTEFVSIYSIA